MGFADLVKPLILAVARTASAANVIKTGREKLAKAPPTRLRTESALYEASKSEWLKTHRGEFVVIRGTELLGFYSDFHNAYREGVKQYGTNTDFLVKRIALHEPVFVVF